MVFLRRRRSSSSGSEHHAVPIAGMNVLMMASPKTRSCHQSVNACHASRIGTGIGKIDVLVIFDTVLGEYPNL